MRTLILIAVLLFPLTAFAACEENLAATGEYGAILRQRQDDLAKEVAIERTKRFGAERLIEQLQKANAELEKKLKAAEPKPEVKP